MPSSVGIPRNSDGMHNLEKARAMGMVTKRVMVRKRGRA